MALSKGCTIGLIIAGVVVLLIIIGGVLLWVNKDKILEAGTDFLIDNTETEIVANLPEGYTEDNVRTIMSDLKAAIKNKEVAAPDIQEMAQTFQNAMADKTIDKEEGADILVLIQEALGQEPILPEVEDIPDSLQAVPDSI
ncbi:MAG: hypothetical protein GY841_03520 [FCB group bacterium]|nr:hypothetical protein [FCB group bacterium]